MTDHVWPDSITVQAEIGMPDSRHMLAVYGPDPLAVAITGCISALALDNGCGVRFTMSPLYLRRAEQNARWIEDNL